MPGWRDRVLAHFVPEAARLWIVADPDGVLLEAGLVESLVTSGFEMLELDDNVAFRFIYETSYREPWDRGSHQNRAVIVRTSRDDPRLPYDLGRAGRRVNLSLAELFPNLDYGVVAALDIADLETLDQSLTYLKPPMLGEGASKDFVLRHVFHVDADQVVTVNDLMRTLLMLHTSGRTLPGLIADRLFQRLQRAPFSRWPLAHLIGDRPTFLRFLQERWSRFVVKWVAEEPSALNSEGGNVGVAEHVADYEVAGPIDLPFGAEDIRRYVDTLFLEGLLAPIEYPGSDRVRPEEMDRSWIAVGIRSDSAAQHTRQLIGLLEHAEQSVPGAGARYQEWLVFARVWGKLIAARYGRKTATTPVIDEPADRIAQLVDLVDTTFTDWMQRRYGALYSQMGNEPVMLHHVPRTMARQLEVPGTGGVALVIVDGLAIDQWVTVGEVLRQQRPVLPVEESAVFAWVPTVTSVSRQTAFAGRIPMHFPSSIQTTSREPALWRQFWMDQGLATQEVAYAKLIGNVWQPTDLRNLLSQPKLRAIGIVVDAVDKIMHGMHLGTAGMHNQVRQWTEEGALAQILDQLLERGFEVFLSSDHGNVAATGCGSPREGALAVTRGQRARIYADPVLRTRVKASFPESIEWPPIGLPGEYFPLLAPGRSAFISENERCVTHGGITLEEVVVPFIRIRHPR